MIQELKESKQGDYSDRPGLIEATKNSDVLKLTESGFYWDFVNDEVNTLRSTTTSIASCSSTSTCTAS